MNINEQAAKAFAAGTPFKSINTKVNTYQEEQITTMYLHNNPIAKRDKGQLFIATRGYATLTTKARLNAILKLLGYPGLYQKQGQWFFTNSLRYPSTQDWVKVEF